MIEVDKAAAAWNAAPAHVKIMAGAYVGPLLAALVALAAKVSQLEERLNDGSR